MRFHRARTLLALLATLLVLGGGMPAALGQEAGTPEAAPQGPDIVFGVYPQGGAEGIFFEAAIAPGESAELTLALLNAGEASLSLLSYPANAYSMTNGGMGVAFQQQERTGQTTWLEYPEGVVEVAPGEEHLVPFTVTVPEGTAPGQYVTAIGVETAESYALGDGSPFSQVLRKVVAVAVMVPGPIEPAFAIGDPALEMVDGSTVLRLPIENSGNIRVRPGGTVTVGDADGKALATGEVEMSSVYAGDTANYELWMAVSLPPAEYTVSAHLEDADTGATAAIESASVTLAPPPATPIPPAPATPVVAAPTPSPVPEPVTIEATIAPNADPIQFAQVDVTIANTGAHVSRSRVTLEISRDGEVVEEMVLDDNLPLPVGETEVAQRYIPPTGWDSGTWTFGLTVHAVNPNADTETLLVSAAEIATIEVP